MKHEYKSLAIFAALFLLAGYVYEKQGKPATQAATLTQLQTQGDAGTNVPVITAPIATTLVEYEGI